MPLISAAICPHPMKLIPEVFGTSGGEWERLRAACLESVRQLEIPVWDLTPGRGPSFEARPTIVIVGGDDTTKEFDAAGAYGSLLSNGVFWTYGWGQEAEDPLPLPLSLTLGYWLLLNSRPGDTGVIIADIAFQAIDFDASPQECAALGQNLAGRAERVVMIVMGEGSSCLTATRRTEHGEQAKRLDASVVRALENADANALLDPMECPALGRAAWQVLAGAAAGHQFQGRLHWDEALDGRRYFVASWTRRPLVVDVDR